MQKVMILAESGGTKTDWSVIESGVEVQRLTTMSFHPQMLSSSQVIEVMKLIPALTNPDATLLLYSAGCFREEGKKRMEELLEPFSCQKVIKSDLEAAVEATGLTEGWVAILGTGSALIQFDEMGFHLHGGLGWDKGDEGSGFYFGKLIVEEVMNGVQIPDLSVDEKETLVKQYGLVCSKSSYSKLSKQLPLNKYRTYHEENIRRFVERYVKDKSVKNLTLVGGYANAIRDTLSSVFKSYSIGIESVICFPVDLIKRKYLHF